MKRLKTTLLSDSSKYLHLAICVTVYLFTKTTYIAIFLLIVYLCYLFKKSKNILIYALIIFSLIEIRTAVINQKNLIEEGTIVAIEPDYLIIRNNGKHLVYVNNSNDFQVGMKVVITLEPVNYDQKNLVGGFDYHHYLKSKGIFTVSRARQIEISKKTLVKEIIPEKLNRYFQDKYFKKTADYLELFILGRNDNLDQEIYQKATSLGINHLFAISGMHLGLILAGVNLILNRLYLKKQTHRQVILGFLILYNLITGFSISIVRASALSYLVFFSHDKSFTKADYLAFIYILFILYNPFVFNNVGFQLSFLISGAIILGNDFWKNDQRFVQVFKVSLLASLVSLPVILDLNGSFGLLNPLYNPPFIYFVSYLFLPFSFLVVVFPILEPIYLEIIFLFEQIVKAVWNLNLYLDIKFTANVFVTAYWLWLFFALINWKKLKKQMIIGIFAIIFFFNHFYQTISPLSYVRILDVNQGDAIHLHHGKYDILIDTGDEDNYDTVINYFKTLNINQIDLLIITHFHDDHEKEAMDLSNQIDIGKLIVNRYNQKYKHLNQLAVKEGESFICGPFNLIFLNSHNGDDENNNSLVFLVRVGSDNWLFTGDIEADIEKDLIRKYDFEIDCLKVPHHGSNTSSTEAFIDSLQGKYALISVGYNTYDHPSDKVIERLKINNYQIYRTDVSGTITFYYYRSYEFAIVETYKLNNLRKYQIKT